MSATSQLGMTAAAEFGEALRATLARRGMTQRALAAAIGVGGTRVNQWATGHTLPTMERVEAIAEALCDDHLVRLAIRLRTSSCEVCGAPAITGSWNARNRYCTKNCRVVAAARRRRDKARPGLTARLVIAENRAEALRKAVQAHCMGCEPTAVCRDATCRLRPVSPLPLASDVVRAHRAAGAPPRARQPEQRALAGAGRG